MVNILYALNGCFAKGGTEAFILNHYNYINKNNVHIDFIVHGEKEESYNNETHRQLEQNGSTIYYVTPRGINLRKNKAEIDDIFKKNKYDIVHSHMDAAGSFVLKIAEKNNVKIRVAHSHNTSHQIKVKGIKTLIHYLILEKARHDIRKYATHFLACSTEAGKWLFGEKKVNNGNVIIMKNAINVDKFKVDIDIRNQIRKKLNIEDKFVIGHIGRFNMQKNHSFLIDIFAKVYEKNKNAVLLLIGTGELEEQIKNKVRNLSLMDNVIFYGTTNEVNKLVQAMDIFVLPSLFEGLPVVNIEVQASGLKSVISDTISKEVSITDNIEYLSLNDSTEKWADKILEFNNGYEHKDMSQKIIDAGYNIKVNAKKLEDFYIQCFEKSK